MVRLRVCRKEWNSFKWVGLICDQTDRCDGEAETIGLDLDESNQKKEDTTIEALEAKVAHRREKARMEAELEEMRRLLAEANAKAQKPGQEDIKTSSNTSKRLDLSSQL